MSKNKFADRQIALLNIAQVMIILIGMVLIYSIVPIFEILTYVKYGMCCKIMYLTLCGTCVLAIIEVHLTIHDLKMLSNEPEAICVVDDYVKYVKVDGAVHELGMYWKLTNMLCDEYTVSINGRRIALTKPPVYMEEPKDGTKK